MATQFKHLFSPLKIGNITVKNRIVITGHETAMDFSRDDNDGEQYIEYIRARAKGGPGLIICSTIEAHPTSEALRVTAPSHDIIKEKLRRLALAAHEYDAKILMQINHYGREMDSHESLKPLWAFSALPSPDMREMPHEMTVEEIKEIINAFAGYALDCKEAGFDGVEIHGSHGYMLQQSWSWFTNRRTDQYGEQMAFAYELIDKVREAVGRDFVISVRISMDDLMPGGLNVDKMKEIAQKLEATGKIDLINVSMGALNVTYAYAIASMYVPLGAFVPLTGVIRERLTRVPIIAAGRIKDPIQAEKILADGQADLVAMTRAHLVDPETTNKAMAGELDDIRKCIACNYGCIERVFRGQHVLCVQNPTVGNEREFGKLERASIPKNVMIVGLGPAGMECARVAALRGHQVEGYEKESEPGGQVNLYCKDPARVEFEDMTRYQIMQLKKLGVLIHTGIDVTDGLVRQKAPECLVVATGSIPREITFPISEEFVPGYDDETVMDLFEVYRNPKDVGDNVLIFDRVGFLQGLTTALFLAEMGKHVEIVTPLLFAGMDAGYTYLPLLYDRLYRKGVKFTPSLEVKEIANHKVTLVNVFSYAEQTREKVDTLIPVLPQKAEDRLFRSMRKEIKEVHVIGDAAAPRNLLQAIRDGFLLGHKI